MGRAAIVQLVPAALQRLADLLPTILIQTLREQFARLGALDQQVRQVERRRRKWHRQDEDSRRIADIPGVGPFNATAAIATMGDPRTFKSGRGFAAWLGLVPRQHGVGGRTQLLGVSKRGDIYLRTLLIHGARSVLMTCKALPSWLEGVLERRPKNVAVVALANKMARMIWAISISKNPYQDRTPQSLSAS